MSWASRRRGIYLLGIISFLTIVIGIPLAKYSYSPSTCTDGKQNQGETAPDKGGPCPVLDERTLSPASVLWSRSFEVRSGLYNAVAYVENPNENAGVRISNAIRYHFGMYDSRNILVAERTGATFIIPGSITPIFEANIDAGNRVIAHTYLEFTGQFIWERLINPAKAITISNKEILDVSSEPRILAIAENMSVSPISDISFIVVVFDTSGTAYATSRTSLPRISPGEKQQITFTWPYPFPSRVGRVDIFPLLSPSPLR